MVLTAVELDVFTTAGDGATAEEVSRTIGADAQGTEMLLNALVALRLLAKDGGVAVTPISRRFFTAGGQNDARAAMMHTVGQWERWSKLTDAVRAGGDVGAEIPDRESDWLAAGASRVSRMLDVGGGSGAYSIAFARANPDLHAEVLDLASVLPMTRGYIAAAELESRVTTRAGDLRADAFGSGCDLVFVSAICHMLGPAENRDLLKRCFAATAPGGRIVINDFILDADKTAPKAGALFSLTMLVGTRQLLGGRIPGVARRGGIPGCRADPAGGSNEPDGGEYAVKGAFFTALLTPCGRIESAATSPLTLNSRIVVR